MSGPITLPTHSKGGSPLDHYGRSRCAAYRREEFMLCPSCPPDTKKHNPKCQHCGGYGEMPK